MNINLLDRAQLFNRLKFSMVKKEVVQLAQSFSLVGVQPTELLLLTSDGNKATAFHSAWVLENMLLPYPDALDYYLPVLIERLVECKNGSVTRHLAKLVAFGINRIVEGKVSKVFEKVFWRINHEPLIEACFTRFTDENSRPAVKAHSLDILCSLSKRNKWIAVELPQVIENQMEFGTPGIKAKGKAILKQLNSRGSKSALYQ